MHRDGFIHPSIRSPFFGNKQEIHELFETKGRTAFITVHLHTDTHRDLTYLFIDRIRLENFK